MKKKIIIGLCAIGFICVVFGGIVYLGLKADTHLSVRDIAPDFSLSDQHGNTVVLREVLKQHKGALLAFYPKDFTPG